MSNTPRFARKSMVVTGAAQGIGKQVAIDAAGEGARVTLVDRSPLVEAVAAEIVASGGQAASLIVDLETWEGNVEAMRTAHKAHGAIDILVTNVGGAIWMKPFQHFDEKQIAAEVQRSLFPTLWGCRAALPYMLAPRISASMPSPREERQRPLAPSPATPPRRTARRRPGARRSFRKRSSRAI